MNESIIFAIEMLTGELEISYSLYPLKRLGSMPFFRITVPRFPSIRRGMYTFQTKLSRV